jgi:cytochrome P450
MRDLQVRNGATTLFLADHETTANAMTWAWYLLSRHTKAEAGLPAEVDSVLQGNLPNLEDVARFRYMVFAQSMRLFPLAWVIRRRALRNSQLDGLFIPARSVIVISQFVAHRDPRFFPDPEKSDPDRWSPEEQAARSWFSYFPFGGAPRVCIGSQFAWMEGVLIMATLAQLWQFCLIPGQTVRPRPMITFGPRYCMMMTLERRG